MLTHPRRLAQTGLALGVLLALLIAPQTRWLVRLQALTCLNLYHPLPGVVPEGCDAYTTSGENDARLLRRVAERHPDDYDTQYAYAEAKPGAPETLAALRALAVRFPNRPALYANLLRHETRGNVTLHRVEDYMGSPLAQGYKPDPPPTPAALATFDEEAAIGERLDPDNAYFPMMRAVGLFAAHRDAEGLQAVHRASRKPHWREYITEDVHSQWRLHEEAFGDPGALGHIALFSQVLFPQYAGLRAVARVTAYKAILAERAGRAEEGLAIRRDLMRCARLMRDQSTSYIGSLVAIAIGSIARSQPGGAAGPYGNDPKLTPEQNMGKRVDLYCAYVRRIGHPEDAETARADFAAGERVRALQQAGIFQRITIEGARLVWLWVAGVAALANLLWLLALGGLASALTRTRWARAAGQGAGGRAPLGRKAVFKRTLIALGVMAAVLLLADQFLHFPGLTGWPGAVVGFAATLLLVLLVFGLPPTVAVYVMRHGVRRPHFPRPSFAWRGAGRKLLAPLSAALLLIVVYNLALWQAGGISSLIFGWNGLMTLQGDSGPDQSNGPATGLSPSEQALLWCVLLSLALPLLVALFSAIAARVRGVPVGAGLVRGFGSAAVPLACLLLLVYGGLTLETVRQDNVVSAGAERTVTGEGQYLAERTGQPWPVR